MNKKLEHQDSKKAKPPIVDGWIELSPGDKVMIDERLGKDWQQQGEKMKELRGRILAVCIQIELLLDSLLRHLFFPEHLITIDHTKTDLKISELSVMFLYEVIKDLRFNDKCRIFKKLSVQHKLLKDKDCKILITSLNDVRKIRNLFAHSAISFVPVGNPPNQVLRPEGYSESKRIILDQEYITNCEKLFSRTIQLMDSLQRAVTQIKQNEK